MSLRAFYRNEEGWSRLGQVIRSELAPFPGRMDAVWRYVLSSALVVVISMTLQVPSLALSLIMVFLTAQENTVLTRVSGILLVVGTTIAVSLTIVLVKLTIDYAMVRIIAACVVSFAGMYFMRISKFGVVGFLVAQFVLYLQSLVDLPVAPDAIVRSLLWVWVAITYPVVITITINYLFLPRHPARLLSKEMCRQLDEVSRQLNVLPFKNAKSFLSPAAVARGVLLLNRHLVFAVRGDPSYERDRSRHLGRIAAIDRLHTAAAHLSSMTPVEMSWTDAGRVRKLLASIAQFRKAIKNGEQFSIPRDHFSAPLGSGALDSVLREMEHAILAAAQGDSLPSSTRVTTKDSGIAADAFSNPVYAQFALKTVLAAMVCYLFYTAVQWPGIHTSMLTCFIIALPSLGASSHKGLMRVIGCVIGSLIALAATVFVFPYIESITGLLLLTLPIVAVGAWIAAGSPRTNYIGVQIVFAYALARLGQFGPTIDLTEIRDRMIGILVGVAVSLFVSAVLWPEREGEAMKKLLAKLLRSVAFLSRIGTEGSDEIERSRAIHSARLQGWSLLAENREMQARVALEPGWQYDHDAVTDDVTSVLSDVQEVLFAVSWLQVISHQTGVRLARPMAAAVDSFRECAAECADRLAKRLEGGASNDFGLPIAEALAALDRHSVASKDAADPNLDAVVSAAHQVVERIVHLDSRLSTATI